MEAVKWEEGMSVGIKEIDDQHRYFLELINGLYESIIQENTEKVLDETVQKLSAYAKLHFETEERYLAEVGYDKAEEHKREHALLLEQVEGFADEHREFAKLDLSWKLLEFMQNWLVDHLENEDSVYAQCLPQKGA